MQQASDIQSHDGPRTLATGYLFGIPVRDLGWFATLLMSGATGFMAFFIGTFVGIVSISIFNGITHRSVSLDLSYKLFGLILGGIVLATSTTYLGTLWVKRKLRKI